MDTRVDTVSVWKKQNTQGLVLTIFVIISKQNKCKFFGYQTKYEYFAGFSYLNSTLNDLHLYITVFLTI